MSDGTLQTLDITMLDDVGTGANQLIQLDSNAKIPACSGAALTNLPGVTKNASDPAIATNPSGGVGSVWQNTTSGEMFICTDATAGENVWTNVGAGSGNVAPFKFPGENYGYSHGGTLPTSNVIEKVSFTTDGHATDVGDMTRSMGESSGCSSASHGYVCGGGAPVSNVIERFPFASDTNASDVGDMISARRDVGTTSSETHGFVHSGQQVNIIERFAYAASSSSADVGDLGYLPSHAAGSSDPDGGFGYAHGGWAAPGPARSNIIERYAFAASANGSDVGDLAFGSGQAGGNSSTTHGYSHGIGEVGLNNYIQKFAFAASATATDVGDLTQNVFVPCGVSATAYSYRMGGCYPNGGVGVNIIDKWPHASDTNASDVGDLTATKGYQGPSGCQF
tara:strand:+ start:30 stop:1211 length:1182 start_codon:yes stop_codon:yes gene_type:complete